MQGENLMRDFVTTEYTEAGLLGARRIHAPKMNEVNGGYTCTEGVRLPDEQREELCEAKS